MAIISAAPVEGVPAVSPVTVPTLTPVVLSDEYAGVTDGDACTSIMVDPDEVAERGIAAALSADALLTEWDGWDPAEPGKLRDTWETTVAAGDLAAILDREGPCLIVRLTVETWAEDGAGDILGTALVMRPLDAAAARTYVLDPGVRGTVLCPACACTLEAGEDVPGLPSEGGPLAHVCDLTDGVCGACGEMSEGPWSGYGVYAPVIIA